MNSNLKYYVLGSYCLTNDWQVQNIYTRLIEHKDNTYYDLIKLHAFIHLKGYWYNYIRGFISNTFIVLI